jgi:GntR family negative regulator for fad regulon and positive regulator of fabA
MQNDAREFSCDEVAQKLPNHQKSWPACRWLRKTMQGRFCPASRDRNARIIKKGLYMNWDAPLKPAELSELRLIRAILDGQFPIDSNLPNERELAVSLGVTRPTLRETLQRLGRDGWLEIRHGKPTRVRNYWREGNLGVLAAIAQFPDSLPPGFTADMLSFRSLLAPAYTRLAVERAASQVAELLQPYQELEDDPQVFTDWDWRLQIELTRLCGNPVFTLIYNSFAGLYQVLGVVYFRHAGNRALSQQFYRDLLGCAKVGDGPVAEKVVRRTMQASQKLWEELNRKAR